MEELLKRPTEEQLQEIKDARLRIKDAKEASRKSTSPLDPNAKDQQRDDYLDLNHISVGW